MKYFSILLFLILSYSVYSQEDSLWTLKLNEIVINDNLERQVDAKVLKDDIARIRPHDLGDVFVNEPGFGVIKRGNFATEPVLRSFKYDQLNIRYNASSTVKNSCPSRMDPVTVHITPEELSSIEIIKGPYSVRYGQTMGGIINLVQEEPKFTSELTFSGKLETGYETNGNGKYSSAGISISKSKLNLIVKGSWKDYDNYISGSGKEIASSFNTKGYNALLGIKPHKNHLLSISFSQNLVTDVLHAGLPMDADKDFSSIIDLSYAWKDVLPFITSLTLKSYYSDVDHIMSNKLRPNFTASHAESIVASQTGGGKLEAAIPLLSGDLHTGIDFQHVHKDGDRSREVFINTCTGMTLPEPKLFTDLIWQNSWTRNIGVYAEWTGKLKHGTTLSGGLRIDKFNANSEDPADDFAEVYNNLLNANEDVQLSGGVTFKKKLASKTYLTFSFGKGIRNADLLERYINHFTVGMDTYEYLGNPNLQPEKNYQGDLTLSYFSSQLTVHANIFYSYLKDHITAYVDTTVQRKFMSCMDPKYVKRFTNIDEALQTGFEFGIKYKLSKNWNLNGDVSYTYAQNLEWDEALPEIPPLTTHASLQYNLKKIKADLTYRWVASQDRISTSFNESTSETFQLVDFHLKYDPWERLSFFFAVNNLFDVEYYEHLSRPYRNMDENSMFYEPGRNFNIGLKLSF